jgi:hypothetical protein
VLTKNWDKLKPKEGVVRIDDTNQYVKDYCDEIFEYLLQKEQKEPLRPDFITSQPQLTEKIRDILVDWLCDVSVKFKLSTETFFLSINLMDRYLCLRQVERHRFQGLGLVCLFIAAKYSRG